MKANLVPSWSFLAIEPIAKVAKKKMKKEFSTLFADRTSLKVRRECFWALFAIAEASLTTPQREPAYRQHLAVQFFYALVDISDHSEMPDRDMQRWQNAVVGRAIAFEKQPTHAVVLAPARSAIAGV